ncbi:hypothetical protein WSM22_39190 [Cytophagales bacterium WSM2-2]|nr:hypothetical protein WSM22_39190 [Cytophagales bacterium WSM2-2]
MNAQKKEDAPETVKGDCDGGELRALGWSDDGRIFAYRDFYYRNGIVINSAFYVTVIDVVTDSVLWQFDKYWNTDNSGEGNSGPHVANIEQAWDLVSGDVIAPLRKKFGIRVNLDFQEHEICKDFPLYPDGPDGNYFTAAAVKEERGEAANIKVNVLYSLKGVSKDVCDFVEEGGFNQYLLDSPCISGYFINPQHDKIVISFKIGYPENNAPLIRQRVTGCNLTWFKKH